MPKLYEYLGLIILFYSHEHEPIHVHCKFQGKESKAELVFENGKFVEVRITGVTGKEPLDSQNLKKFKKLVETYRDDIVRKWVDFFVYNKPIESERITKKI
jgi:hypothetical protein